MQSGLPLVTIHRRPWPVAEYLFEVKLVAVVRVRASEAGGPFVLATPLSYYSSWGLVAQGAATAMNETVLNKLERRLGGLHARQRLGIETDHEAQIFGQGINFFHIENWYSIHSVIRTTLKLLGLYRRGRKNAEQIQIRHNHVGQQDTAKPVRRLHATSYQRSARGY